MGSAKPNISHVSSVIDPRVDPLSESLQALRFLLQDVTLSLLSLVTPMASPSGSSTTPSFEFVDAADQKQLWYSWTPALLLNMETASARSPVGLSMIAVVRNVLKPVHDAHLYNDSTI